jgi:ZIP family zinc transporter
MSHPVVSVLSYGAICAGALAVGGASAAYWPPSSRVRSAIQHIAAGLVFAAAGVEVLPDVMHRGLPLAAALGFALGVALMLVIRTVAQQFGGRGGVNWTFIGVVVVDICIDGVLIGVSAVTGRGQGQQALLVTVALGVELLSLGLSMAATLGRSGVSLKRIILTTSLVALSPLVGAVAGSFLGRALSGGWIEGVLAFAVAVLLYLAAEELLKEAHETAETVLSTALFFGAFLALLLIDMVIRSGAG